MAKNILLTALLVVGSTVAADPADIRLTKTQLDVNFNTMIDAGNVTKNSIQKHIEDQITQASEEEDSDRSRVLDFVDVEVGIGKEPGVVVDRRFDSVSEPITFGLIDLKALAKIY